MIFELLHMYILLMFQGTGFRTCLWDGNLLLLPCDSGKLTWWNVGGEKEEELHTGVRDLVSHVSLSASGNGIWICGSNMSFFELVRSSEGAYSCLRFEKLG